MWERVCRSWDPGTVAEDNGMVVFPQSRHRTTSMGPSNSTGYTSKRNESGPHSDLYTHTHSSTIHSSQEVKQLSQWMSGWMDTPNTCTESGLLFGLRKEVLTLITAWINPEDTTGSEKCRSQETNTS